MDDTQIIELYWARNEDAITETDRKYGSWCHGIAQRILQIREESADPGGKRGVRERYISEGLEQPPA